MTMTAGERWLAKHMKDPDFAKAYHDAGRIITEVDAFINALRDAGIKIPFGLSENELARMICETQESGMDGEGSIDHKE